MTARIVALAEWQAHLTAIQHLGEFQARLVERDAAARHSGRSDAAETVRPSYGTAMSRSGLSFAGVRCDGAQAPVRGSDTSADQAQILERAAGESVGRVKDAAPEEENRG